MSNNAADRDTFMRNVRISICWPVILAFIVNPLFAGSWFAYSAAYQSDDGLLPRDWQIGLPLVYFISSVFLGCGAALNHVEKRLRERGYEQRRTAPLTADWALNVGICFGYTYWLSQKDLDKTSERMAWFYLVTNVATVWLGLILGFMGPVWWFTVRVR